MEQAEFKCPTTSIIQEETGMEPLEPENLCTENIEVLDATQEGSSLILVECHFCRICGEESKELVYVFDEHGIALNLAQKIRWHLPIKVLEDDVLPTSLCYLCVSRLDGCHEFANLSLETEDKLVKLFSSAAETEEAWKEIGPSLVTQNTDIPQMRTRRPVFPTSQLIEAMSLLRQEKEKEREKYKSVMSLSSPNQVSEADCLKSSYETVYHMENHAFDGEVVQVYDVTVDSENVNTLQTSQWTSNFEAQETSKFENNESSKSVANDVDGSMISKLHSLKDSQTRGTSKFKDPSVIIDHHESGDSVLVEDLNLIHSSHSAGILSFSSSIKAATEHVLIEKNEMEQTQRFICEHCGKFFKARRSLNDHINAHHSATAPFKCDKCPRTFTSLGGWDVHKATHSSEKPYLCDICGKSFKHASHLYSHKRSHLPVDKKHTQICVVCGKGFRSAFHLKEHKNIHTDVKPYECPVCFKTFHKRIQLRQHSYTHLEVKPFTCPVCGKGFNRRGNLASHCRQHTDRGKLACKVCGEQFDQPAEKRAHEKTHSAEDLDRPRAELYKCDVCGKTFDKRKGLKVHLDSHDPEKVYPCDFCGKILSSRASLSYHVRSLHTGERSHACSFCGKKYVSRFLCSVHERVHTGDKPFSCSVCATSFRSSSNLAQHMRVHTERRTVQCPQCEKTFLRNGALNVHMRVHTGERPFVCDQCGKAFTQKNDMLKHARVHAGGGAHACRACGDTFGLRRELVRHRAAGDCGAFKAAGGIEAAGQVEDEELMQSLELDVSQNLIGELHRF